MRLRLIAGAAAIASEDFGRGVHCFFSASAGPSAVAFSEVHVTVSVLRFQPPTALPHHHLSMKGPWDHLHMEPPSEGLSLEQRLNIPDTQTHRTPASPSGSGVYPTCPA